MAAQRVPARLAMPEVPPEKEEPSQFALAVAGQLAKARKALGWTQIEAGEKAGLSVNVIGLWERAEQKPTAENLAAICKLYGVSTDWVLGLTEQPEIDPGHAVIDLALEKAVHDAGSLDEAIAAARKADALTPDGESVQIGYKVPRGFGLIASDAFDDRMRAVKKKLAELHRNPKPKRGSGAKGKGAADG